MPGTTTVSWDAPFAAVPAWLVVADVSANAIHLYAFLALHIGDKPPTHDEIGATLRISQKAVDSALAELVGVGAVERDHHSYRLLTAQPLGRPGPAPELLPELREDDMSKPPKMPRVNGRDLALDAISQECGIEDRSPRIPQAVAALHGRRGGKGITQLFWEECRERAARTDQPASLAALHANGAGYASILAQQIHSRAALIRQVQPWRTTMFPKDIRDLWLDALNMPAPATGRRGLTPDEIRQIR